MSLHSVRSNKSGTEDSQPAPPASARSFPVVGEGTALVSELLAIIEGSTNRAVIAKRRAYRWDGSTLSIKPEVAYDYVDNELEESSERLEELLGLSKRAGGLNDLRSSLQKGYDESKPIELSTSSDGATVYMVRDGWSRLYLARELGMETVPVKKLHTGLTIKRRSS